MAAAGDCDSVAPGSKRLGGKYTSNSTHLEFRAREGLGHSRSLVEVWHAEFTLSVRVRVGVCYCVRQPHPRAVQASALSRELIIKT